MVTEIPAKVLFLNECRERLSQSLTYRPTRYKSVTYSGLIHVGVVLYYGRGTYFYACVTIGTNDTVKVEIWDVVDQGKGN